MQNRTFTNGDGRG